MGYSQRSDRMISPVTEEQRQTAEAMIRNLPFDTRIDMRGSATITPSRLWALDRGMTLHEVAVSRLPDERAHLTVISDQPLDPSRRALLAVQEDSGRESRLTGRLGASRPGRRAEDRHLLRPLFYAVFEPEGG